MYMYIFQGICPENGSAALKVFFKGRKMCRKKCDDYSAIGHARQPARSSAERSGWLPLISTLLWWLRATAVYETNTLTLTVSQSDTINQWLALRSLSYTKCVNHFCGIISRPDQPFVSVSPFVSYVHRACQTVFSDMWY